MQSLPLKVVNPSRRQLYPRQRKRRNVESINWNFKHLNDNIVISWECLSRYKNIRIYTRRWRWRESEPSTESYRRSRRRIGWLLATQRDRAREKRGVVWWEWDGRNAESVVGRVLVVWSREYWRTLFQQLVYWHVYYWRALTLCLLVVRL